ncbi:MAG: hypothetical protein ISR44_10890 [Rhodospirillales bacterium]|nr:hypothetical protein [Rhodospirillales bacterium]
MISPLKIRFFTVFGLPLVLGGCALPVGLQVASLVADGISFVATDKTLTDHGISIITQRDCAVWRGFKGDDICRTPDLDAPMVSASDEPIFFEPGPDEAEPFAMEDSSLRVAASPPDEEEEVITIEIDGLK